MRAGRLLSILMLLQLRVRVTAQALADELEVSVRTIYRDVEELAAAGIPVYADRGPGGGFQLVDGYRTRLTGLAEGEAEAVFMIGMPGPAAALGLADAAESAGRKLLAALPPSASEGAGRLGARFHLDPIEWYRSADVPDHLPALARAALDGRTVSMTYESWTSTRPWRIEPLGLVLKAGSWYAVARSRGRTTTFRVAAMRDVMVEDGTFERPAGFNLPAWWREQLERFETSLRPHDALVRASPEGCRRLSRLGAYAARAVAEAGPADAAGWTAVRLPVENVDHAATLLLGIGPEIEVTDPPALRERIRTLAAAIADRHSAQE